MLESAINNAIKKVTRNFFSYIVIKSRYITLKLPGKQNINNKYNSNTFNAPDIRKLKHSDVHTKSHKQETWYSRIDQ